MLQKSISFIFLISCILSTTQVLFGQNKSVSIPIYENGDTIYGYGWIKKLVNELKLESLTNTKENFRFRVWTSNQVIDISKDFGHVISFERAYSEKNHKRNREGKLYTSKAIIVSNTLNELHELIKNSGILTLPSEENIEGWKLGVDGITYTIEISTSEEYFFKTYWTPQVFPDLKEAVIVLNFVKEIRKLLNLKMVYDQFFSTLPNGCYNTGDISVICKTY